MDVSSNDDGGFKPQYDDLDDGVQLVKPEVSALEAITRSEVAMQLDAAHRYPRSAKRFLNDASTLATYDREVAESCMFTVPRGGKMITGPSIRLAEICASCWGNLHTGARVIDETDTTVIAQAIAWDLERNSRFTIEASRGILDKKGNRFNEDMIRVTGMAAISVGMRNAIFRAIPRAFVNPVYRRAIETAVGNIKTIGDRRDEWIHKLGLMGITPERVFARLGVAGAPDVTLEHLATLIGIKNSVQSGELDIDAAFPAVAAAPLVTIGVGLAPAAAAPAPTAAAPATSSAPAAAAPAAAPVAEGKRVSVGTGKRGRAAPAPAAAAPATAPAPAAPTAAASAASSAPAAPAPAPAAPAGEPPVDPATLLKALATVDDAWKSAPDGAAIIATWPELERAEAMKWALAVLEDAPMAEQARRPPFTNIDAPDDDEPGPAGGAA
jgi:hypothetical protein